MLPIEAEYLVVLNKLKIQTSANPKMDINEVKRSYQRLRDVFGKSCCGCLDVYCIFIIWLMCLDAKRGRELVSPHWRSTINRYPFLREYDATTSPYLLFMSDQAIEAMRASEKWNFYGTFQSAPKIFRQFCSGRIKQQVPAPQNSVAHPLKRKLLCTHLIKTKKSKEIIDNDNDLIETAYYR